MLETASEGQTTGYDPSIALRILKLAHRGIHYDVPKDAPTSVHLAHRAAVLDLMESGLLDGQAFEELTMVDGESISQGPLQPLLTVRTATRGQTVYSSLDYRRNAKGDEFLNGPHSEDAIALAELMERDRGQLQFAPALEEHAGGIPAYTLPDGWIRYELLSKLSRGGYYAHNVLEDYDSRKQKLRIIRELIQEGLLNGKLRLVRTFLDGTCFGPSLESEASYEQNPDRPYYYHWSAPAEITPQGTEWLKAADREAALKLRG